MRKKVKKKRRSGGGKGRAPRCFNGIGPLLINEKKVRPFRNIPINETPFGNGEVIPQILNVAK